jgi:hypothetical protein
MTGKPYLRAKALISRDVYGTAEAVPFVKCLFPICRKPSAPKSMVARIEASPPSRISDTVVQFLGEACGRRRFSHFFTH